MRSIHRASRHTATASSAASGMVEMVSSASSQFWAKATAHSSANSSTWLTPSVAQLCRKRRRLVVSAATRLSTSPGGLAAMKRSDIACTLA